MYGYKDIFNPWGVGAVPLKPVGFLFSEMGYRKGLDSPRWAIKRSKILKRDGYKCTVCGSDKNLQVHHTYYVRGAEPWGYPDDSLLTLCEKCHHEYHEYHELTILPAFIREDNKKPNHRRNKKKKKPLIKEPTKRSKNTARHRIHPPTYKKCINGVWFNFEVKY